ncbi:MAG: hypothetical protein VX154_01225 [Pseudomonadota bacterium]|nr:hypothetical protein [Pseudomonadota bacterium]
MFKVKTFKILLALTLLLPLAACGNRTPIEKPADRVMDSQSF